MKRAHQSGFSVIEALVAVAIVALAMLPLASLQGQVSRAAARQQQVQMRVSAEHNALALLRDLNIMTAPEGVRDLGAGLTLRWRAAPISRLVRGTSGEFDVTLFRVEASVEDANQRAVADFSVDQLGWRAVAAP